jgi:hypothetical protein
VDKLWKICGKADENLRRRVLTLAEITLLRGGVLDIPMADGAVSPSGVSAVISTSHGLPRPASSTPLANCFFGVSVTCPSLAAPGVRLSSDASRSVS